MKLLDQFSVTHKSTAKWIEIYQGDLARIPPEQAVDLLVISAFPNDYIPTRNSLIGALHRRGLSISKLARKKAVDLREAFSCWLSEDIGPLRKRFGFKRIMCFEPWVRGKPTEVVGEIFQSLMPFAHGDPPINSLAMPVVASGDQQVRTADILPPLLEAAVHWLSLGLPINRLKIVAHSDTKAQQLAQTFTAFKTRFQPAFPEISSDYNYHLFISYSHQNRPIVEFIVDELLHQKPDLRIFLDRQEIDTGHSWQQSIFEALDDCHAVVALYSPPYLQSKVCKEEFNIAFYRHRESEEGVLLPVYLFSAELPTYMKIVQFMDCREGDRQRLINACRNIIRHIEK